ncbi:hypothetical protein AJ79_02930 [Helicocarpus griseus UAMH5409]|uniref:Zn(2)-C6 fungal-type domain-containing protein n=1 Tax=Helicocarpus griseus UAMH5409 TaxID=1447875 RepID=A0A2B7Y074_9EURO|nr:hypothetical protein AJ79_02930 [Helicocarpus griseus UAMH5409]
MEQTPRADLGRSGPRKKTGCLTCRRRKVKCDEEKPVCSNCVRLRLSCQYGTSGRRQSRDPRRSFDVHARRARDDGRFETSPVGVEGMINNINSPESATAFDVMSSTGENSVSGPVLTEYTCHTRHSSVDIGQFIRHSAHESRRLDPDQQDSDNGVAIRCISVSSGSPMSVAMTSTAPVSSNSSARRRPNGSNHLLGLSLSMEDNSSTLRRNDSSSIDRAEPSLAMPPGYGEQLLQNFLRSAAPPAVFAPLEIEWSFVQSTVVTLAQNFAPLMSAVYCYSAVCISLREGRSCQWAGPYHKDSTLGLQAYTSDDDFEQDTLQMIFPTYFFLMLAELLSESTVSEPGHSFPTLRSAHTFIRKHLPKTASWQGVNRLFVSWTLLLEIKSIIAGRDGDPLLSPTSTPIQFPSKDDPNPAQGQQHRGPDNPLPLPAFLIYTTLLHPALSFHVTAQSLTRRIVHIDLHHRTRGTLSDEYAVLQTAHKISADLEELWHDRPPIIGIHDRRAEELGDVIADPSMARALCSACRMFVVNYLALFIYLHRVAFSIYPRTEKVKGAVEGIVRLAQMELEIFWAGSGAGRRETGRAVDCLPAGFLWPLFLAGLEAERDEREWLSEEMRRMAEAGMGEGEEEKEGNSIGWRHPNIDKAIVLFEELERRQNVLKVSADSRCARRDLFRDFFVVI